MDSLARYLLANALRRTAVLHMSGARKSGHRPIRYRVVLNHKSADLSAIRTVVFYAPLAALRDIQVFGLGWEYEVAG